MKIEIDKPVIPQFVADWIESNSSGFNIRDVLEGIDSWTNPDILDWCRKVDGELSCKTLVTAYLYGYDVEEEPLYYAKNKLTGQYLGNKDIGIGSCVPQPFWFFDKGHLQIEKLPKEVFKRVYGLDDTNTDFERVE